LFIYRAGRLTSLKIINLLNGLNNNFIFPGVKTNIEGEDLTGNAYSQGIRIK